LLIPMEGAEGEAWDAYRQPWTWPMLRNEVNSVH
jgi:hypothetical protein